MKNNTILLSENKIQQSKFEDFLKYLLFNDNPPETKYIKLENQDALYENEEIKKIINDDAFHRKQSIEGSEIEEKNNKNLTNSKKNRIIANYKILQIIDSQDIRDIKLLNQFNIKLPTEMLDEKGDIKNEVKEDIAKYEILKIIERLKNISSNEEISQYINIDKDITNIQNEVATIFSKQNFIEENFAKFNNINQKISDAQILRNKIPELEQNFFNKNNISIQEFLNLQKYFEKLNFSIISGDHSFKLIETVYSQDYNNILIIVNSIKKMRGHSEDYLHYAIKNYGSEIINNINTTIEDNKINITDNNKKMILLLDIVSTNDPCNRCSWKVRDIVNIIEKEIEKAGFSNITVKSIYSSTKKMKGLGGVSNNTEYSDNTSGISGSGTKSYCLEPSNSDQYNIDDNSSKGSQNSKMIFISQNLNTDKKAHSENNQNNKCNLKRGIKSEDNKNILNDAKNIVKNLYNSDFSGIGDTPNNQIKPNQNSQLNDTVESKSQKNHNLF